MPGADWFLAAFWELDNDRQIGMQAGPIPSSSIDRWADRYGMSEEERESFRGAVRAMDRVVLEHANTQAREGTDSSSVSSRPMSPQLFDAIFG